MCNHIHWDESLSNLYPILYHITSPDFRESIEENGLSNEFKTHVESYSITDFNEETPHFLSTENGLQNARAMVGGANQNSEKLLEIQINSESLIGFDISEDKSFQCTPNRNGSEDYYEYVRRCIAATDYIAFLEDIPASSFIDLTLITNPSGLPG